MPIQNIQGLVDKNGLSYLTNGDYLNKYYYEGLANLGQRNINDTVLKNVTFTTKELINDIIKISNNNNLDINKLCSFVIYHCENENELGTFYALVKKDNYDDDSDITHDIFDILERIQSDENDNLTDYDYNNYEIKEITINILNTNANESILVLLNKKINIIDALYRSIGGNNIFKNNLFIPLNYEFGYIANGINELAIYSSFKDLYVNNITIGFSNYNDDYELDESVFSNIFYFSNLSSIKTDIYDYYFTTQNDNEVVLVNHKFTLPYIDEDDYWVINGESTKIQAKAHDAVNLNIILAYYHKDNNVAKYDYLSGINNIYTDKIAINQTPNEFNIKNNDTIIKCSLQTPKIEQENLTKENIKINNVLSNSTLVIISKIQDIITDDELYNIEKYGDGFVTTLWKYNENGGNFECICLNDVVLDFNQLTNFENLLKYEVQHIKQVEPDNFLYSHLVFDQIYQQLKQDNSQILSSYPVLQNIKGSNYNNKYANNMNFSLKYVNYVSGEPGIDIKGISKGSDTKYLKNNSNTAVTNAIYQYTENNKINYYNEYIPNYNIPLFDMSEFLIKDANVLNKYNIITVSNTGDLYYSYIGTSHDTNKQTLTIGSSYLNINLGENTLTDYNTKRSFKVQDNLNIDFKNIYAHGNLSVSNDVTIDGNLNLRHFEWIITTVNGIEVKSTVIVPQFKYYVFGNNPYVKLNINSLEQSIKDLKNSLQPSIGTDNAKDYLYISPILTISNSPIKNVESNYKYNDLLVLPNLVKYLGLKSDDVTVFESNTNEIISITNGNTTEKLYLVSSNNILSESLSIVNSTDTGTIINVSNKEFYTGNTLYITYIESSKKLIVNEVQSHKVKSIWKIPTQI